MLVCVEVVCRVMVKNIALTLFEGAPASKLELDMVRSEMSNMHAMLRKELNQLKSDLSSLFTSVRKCKYMSCGSCGPRFLFVFNCCKCPVERTFMEFRPPRILYAI